MFLFIGCCLFVVAVVVQVLIGGEPNLSKTRFRNRATGAEIRYRLMICAGTANAWCLGFTCIMYG